MNYYLTLQVFTPNKVYKGQKLIKLVKAKIMATTNNTTLKVPVIVPVKYSIAISAATAKRIILSVLPMFFVMIPIFYLMNNNTKIWAAYL